MIFSVLFILISVESTIKEKYQKALKIKDPLVAVEYYRQVIKEEPNSPYADSSLFRIGMLYYILGDFDKTIDHFELIYKKGKKSSLYLKTCYWLKFCCENAGDSAKAKEIERKLKNLSPKDEEKKPSPKKKDIVEEKSIIEEKNIEEVKSTKQVEEKVDIGFYTVQLGAYEDPKWLEYFLGKLKENDVEYFIKKVGTYSKIFSGKFETRSGAENYLEEIKNKGFHGFITFDTNP
jgi:tetratricopeptide (TPR) repeat protein